MVHDLLADRAEQQSLETSEASRPDDQQVRALGGGEEAAGGTVADDFRVDTAARGAEGPFDNGVQGFARVRLGEGWVEWHVARRGDLAQVVPREDGGEPSVSQ